jgi:hypothetical protein
MPAKNGTGGALFHESGCGLLARSRFFMRACFFQVAFVFFCARLHGVRFYWESLFDALLVDEIRAG